MRILMISDVYFPRINGVSTSIQTFRRGLHAAGHETILIAPEYPGAAAESEPDILRVPSRGVPRDPEDRAMKLGERLPLMSEDEALALLAANGNLVKRPFALTKTAGVVGFKPDEWERLLAKL